MQTDLIRCPQCFAATSRRKEMLSFLRAGEWRGVLLILRIMYKYPNLYVCRLCARTFSVERMTMWRIR